MLETQGKQQLATKANVKGSGEGSEKGIFSKRNKRHRDRSELCLLEGTASNQSINGT